DSCSTKTQESGHDIERTDQDHRPHHRCACSLSARYGVEAHQDMRQSSRTKDESDTERNQIKGSILSMIENTWLCVVLRNRVAHDGPMRHTDGFGSVFDTTDSDCCRIEG